jgi:hypothetical protein
MHRANICLTCSLPAIGTRGGAVCAILGRGYLGSDASSLSLTTRNSYTSSFHFARCTQHIRQRLITISLLLQGSASCFPMERGTTVCCNEELLRSPMTSRSWEAGKLSHLFFWPRHADAFNEIENLHLTLLIRTPHAMCEASMAP